MLDTAKPREQNGRDSFSRYRAQVRSAAIASLSILEGSNIDRVYCDFHDDFVIRMKTPEGYCYIFYQVKTKDKQNHLWTLNEVFGLKKRTKDKLRQTSDDIKNSFAGKLLLHTISFHESCNAVVFQTNVNSGDDIENLLEDIESKKFVSSFSKTLINNFNLCYETELAEKDIKDNIAKLRIEADVQYLKQGDDNFEPLARNKIYKFSEVDLEYIEAREILLKLLNLVESKSSGIIKEITFESVERLSGISIDDLLSILSISKDAYNSLIEGGDTKAIKSASIIQRTLLASGANNETVEYCSRCKTKWDIWLRNNRHILPEMDLITITSEVRKLLIDENNSGNSISLFSLKNPIKCLMLKLSENQILNDLSEELILGGFFSELVKGKS